MMIIFSNLYNKARNYGKINVKIIFLDKVKDNSIRNEPYLPSLFYSTSRLNGQTPLTQTTINYSIFKRIDLYLMCFDCRKSTYRPCSIKEWMATHMNQSDTEVR